MTHFSDADGERGIAHQVARFESATQDLPGERSLANSAATLRFAASHPSVRADWIRPGIMTYGSAPDFPANSIEHWGLQPAMTLRSKLIGIQHLEAGDTVGYGSNYAAKAPMRIGVVACGYADGYPRHCGTGTPVLVDGVRTQVVGQVSMDMITVDLTPAEQAHANCGIGAEVTLWGHGPRGSVLPIDEVALAANTVGYELMCALAPRVPVAIGPGKAARTRGLLRAAGASAGRDTRPDRRITQNGEASDMPDFPRVHNAPNTHFEKSAPWTCPATSSR